jgi:hypothetical protein
MRVSIHARRPCPNTGEPVALYRFINIGGKGITRTESGFRVHHVGCVWCNNFHAFDLTDVDMEDPVKR